MPEHFDAIVIGAGQAGPALCARLDMLGLKTALLELSRLGGTCVNTGCIPTKTMTASAHVAALARRSRDYGLVVGPEVQADMRAIKARKDDVVRHFSEGLRTWLAGMKNVALIQGHGRFCAPHAVTVGGRTLESERIFVDVGARPLAPDFPGVKEVAYLTSSSMMDVDFVPAHLIVVGGSYVGVEFAQMYRRFGSQVTVVERAPRLVPREDEDVSAEIRAILEREGVEVRTSAQCITLAKAANGVTVGLVCEQGEPVAQGSHILLAVGRAPNTHDLGLEKAGVATDERGYIQVNDELSTNVPGIWALGEANGRGAFTHTAYNDYEIVAANLFEGARRRVSDRITTYALFTDPPLGRAGMTKKEARASGRQVLAASLPMSAVARAREAGELQGFMKVLVDAETKEFIGAAILGMGGDEIVQNLLDLMYAKTPFT